jgi:hypothetical protein
MSAQRTGDLLDFVADNTRLDRREIRRGGRLVAHVRRNALATAPLLKTFNADGPWGMFPDLPSPSTDS